MHLIHIYIYMYTYHHVADVQRPVLLACRKKKKIN